MHNSESEFDGRVVFEHDGCPSGDLTGGSGDVFLRAPPGTRFRGNATLTDLTSGQSGGANGTTGTFGVLGGGSIAQVQTPITLHAGDEVVVSPVVTNPAAGDGQLLVSTSADPGWAAVPVRTAPASSVGGVQISSSAPSAGASSTFLTVRFRVSPAGGLVAGQSSVFLEGPPGTVFLAQGDLTVTTTSDRLPATAVLRLSQPTSVVSPQATSTTAGGTTTVKITFRTSGNGSLVNGQGRIEVLGPPGTVFDNTATTLTDDTTGASYGPGGLTNDAGPTWGPEARWLPFFVPFDVKAGDKVTITDTLTAAPAASSNTGFVVATSSDTAPATASATTGSGSATPPVTAAHAGCGGVVAAGASGLTCTVRFTMPAGASLAAGTGTIAVVGPPDFAMSAAGAQVDDVTTNSSAAVNTINLLGLGPFNGSLATFVAPVGIAAGDTVQLTLDGVSLPPEAGPVALAISTSATTTPATVELATQAVGGLSIVRAAESSAAPGATGITYSAVFRVSRTGGLASGSGTVHLVGPPGVDFSQVTSAVLTDLTTHRSAAANVSPAGDDQILVVTAPVPVGAGDLVELVADGVANPTIPFSGFTLTTSSDGFVVGTAAAHLATNRWVSTIASSLPTPRAAFLPAKSIPANVGIAALLAMFLSWPSSLFNTTFQENEAAILDWWERRTARLRRQRWFRRVVDGLPGAPLRGSRRGTRNARAVGGETSSAADLRCRLRGGRGARMPQRPDVPDKFALDRDFSLGRLLDGVLDHGAGSRHPRLPRAAIPGCTVGVARPPDGARDRGRVRAVQPPDELRAGLSVRDRRRSGVHAPPRADLAGGRRLPQRGCRRSDRTPRLVRLGAGEQRGQRPPRLGGARLPGRHPGDELRRRPRRLVLLPDPDQGPVRLCHQALGLPRVGERLLRRRLPHDSGAPAAGDPRQPLDEPRAARRDARRVRRRRGRVGRVLRALRAEAPTG